MLFLHIFQERGRETTNHDWVSSNTSFHIAKIINQGTAAKKPLINHSFASKSSIMCWNLLLCVFNNLTGHLWLVKFFWCQSDLKCFLSSAFACCTHKPAPEHTNLYPSTWKRLTVPSHARTQSNQTSMSLHQQCFSLVSRHWTENIFSLKSLKIYQLNNQSFPQKKHCMVFMDRLDSFWGLFPSRVFAVTFYALSIAVIRSLSHGMYIEVNISDFPRKITHKKAISRFAEIPNPEMMLKSRAIKQQLWTTVIMPKACEQSRNIFYCH